VNCDSKRSSLPICGQEVRLCETSVLPTNGSFCARCPFDLERKLAQSSFVSLSPNPSPNEYIQASYQLDRYHVETSTDRNASTDLFV